MDTQNNARGESERGQYLSDFDLRGYTNSEVFEWLAYTRPGAFKLVAQAIAKGDRAIENKVLRRWGVW